MSYVFLRWPFHLAYSLLSLLRIIAPNLGSNKKTFFFNIIFENKGFSVQKFAALLKG